MLRLDHNRALTNLAQKAGVAVADIEKLTVWGNHSQQCMLTTVLQSKWRKLKRQNQRCGLEQRCIPSYSW